MQNMTFRPHMENMTFYGFITFVTDLVGVRFLFENTFQLPEAQKNNMTSNGRIDGTTDFGIALTYSINTAISRSALSFYNIDCSKTFSDGTRNNMWCKWLD